MNIVILGGTRGIGRAVARRLSERGDRVFLLGRNDEDLERSASDLSVRGGSDTRETTRGHARCDLADPTSFGPALDAAWERLERVDAVVVTAAAFATQEALEEDVALTHHLVTVNFANTVTFCEHVRCRLLAQGGGTLCVFSSVAGDRGRKPVAIYGASKAGLSHYLEALDHKFRDKGLVTVCVKPGFVKTSMTEGLDPPPFASEPGRVAVEVVRAIDRGSPLLYTPSIWRWIMLVIRMLPRFVMRRIGF